MDWGGSSDIVRILCKRLNPGQYDVRLITGLTRYPSAKTQALFEDLKGSVISVPELRRAINPFLDALALLRLYWLFRREKFDIVHTHTAKAGVLGRISAAAAGVPAVVHTPHGNNFYGYFGPVFSKCVIAVERLMSRLTAKITVFTELEKRDIVRLRVAGPEKVALIQQGLELDPLIELQPDKPKIKKMLGIDPDERVIGMVGRLEPIKGPEYFIRAAAKVCADFKKVRFIAVGEGSLRSKLERLAKSLGVRERCIFTGWRDDVLEIMSILDILVLPSLNEAVGMVLIEAQSQGIPVIASSVGGVPEAVKDNYSGILVAPGNTDGFAQVMKKLLRDEEARRKMGLNGRDWVKGKFGVEEMITAVSGLYGVLA